MCLSVKSAERWSMTESHSIKQVAAFTRNAPENAERACQRSPLLSLEYACTGVLHQHSLVCPHPNHFLPTMLPHVEGPNTRPLLCAPHFQNSSPWSIDHKELSHSAWTLCVSKRRIIHLLSFPLMKVLYSLYPTNFCITVPFVREDRNSYNMRIHYHLLTSGKLSNFSIAWFLLSFCPCTQSRAHQKTPQSQTKCCLLQHFRKEHVLLGEAKKKNTTTLTWSVLSKLHQCTNFSEKRDVSKFLTFQN